MAPRHQLVSAIALVAAVVIGSAACSSADPDPTAVASATQEPVASAVRHVDPKAFAEAMGQPGAVLLDVRTPAEFAAGHIAKATNLDAQAGDFAQRLAALDKAATYAIYCHSGRRSAVAAEQMRVAGFTKIVDLAGGVTAWTGAGRPLVAS